MIRIASYGARLSQRPSNNLMPVVMLLAAPLAIRQTAHLDPRLHRQDRLWDWALRGEPESVRGGDAVDASGLG